MFRGLTFMSVHKLKADLGRSFNIAVNLISSHWKTMIVWRVVTHKAGLLTEFSVQCDVSMRL